jgi:AcrR family transcriptional regulator
MARTHIDKRSRLVSAAVGLAYQNGFGATSLADIAREAEVPLGNLYYYFKTKDEIGEAIVELRLAQLLLASLPNWPAPGKSESPAGRRSVPMSETNSASMPRSITGQQGSRKSWPYRARAASTSILKTLAARSGRRFCRCSTASRGCRCVASSPITTAPPAPSRIFYRLRCWRSCVAAGCYAATSTPNSSTSTTTPSCGRSAREYSGDILYREDIVDGLENAPEAFIGMLSGRNFGKALVRLS